MNGSGYGSYGGNLDLHIGQPMSMPSPYFTESEGRKTPCSEQDPNHDLERAAFYDTCPNSHGTTIVSQLDQPGLPFSWVAKLVINLWLARKGEALTHQSPGQHGSLCSKRASTLLLQSLEAHFIATL